MNLIEEIISNRDEHFNKYRGCSPFFDDSLNSHIILNHSEILELLKKDYLTSNRKNTQFQSITSCPFSTPLIDFSPTR